MAGIQQVSPEVDIDLRELLAGLRRDGVRNLFIAVLAALLAVAAASLIAPRYYAESRLLIETRESAFTRPENAPLDERLDVEGVASQVELIGSSDLLKKVAEELDLAARPEFSGSQSPLGSLLVTLGLKRDPRLVPADERTLQEMRARLDIYRVQNSRVIVVGFSSADPALAAAVPRAMTAAYVEMQREAGLQSTGAATEWLEQEISELRDRVRQAEKQVADFQASSDLLPGRNNEPLATQQLSELASEVSRVRAARASVEATAVALRQALSSGLSASALPETLNSPLIQRLRERQADLQAGIADLSTTLLDNHPRMRSLRSQLQALERQIVAEARNILAGLEAEAAAAKAREEELTAAMNRSKAESARAGEQQVELRALEREAAAQRAVLETYLTRFREAAARRDRNYLPVDVRVFAEAVQPGVPYFPKYVPIALAAFAATLLLLIVWTLLRELYCGRALRQPVAGPVILPEEVPPPPAPARNEPQSAPFVTADPQMDPRPEDAVTVARELSFAQVPPRPAVMTVAAAARYLRASGKPVALFISPEGDAATLASVRMARAISDAGRRVLLLDLTASGAASGPMLEDIRHDGITDLLAGDAHFTDIIHSDYYSNCDVIPAGNSDPAKAMRNADRLPLVLHSLQAAYDLVVVECGPASAAALARLEQNEADLFVASTAEGSGEGQETAEELREAGFRRVFQVSLEEEEARRG